MRCQQFFSNSHLMIHWFQFLRIVIPTSQKIIIPLYLPSSIDGSFQRLELKIYDLNKSVNSELAVLNKKMDTFSEYFNKLVNSSLPSHQGKSLEENISLLRKILCTKDEIIKKLLVLFHDLTILTILHKNRKIHLSHDPVFYNCNKYRIPLKRITKDRSKISQWKIYMWEIYRKISSNKIFVNFLS